MNESAAPRRVRSRHPGNDSNAVRCAPRSAGNGNQLACGLDAVHEEQRLAAERQVSAVGARRLSRAQLRLKWRAGNRASGWPTSQPHRGV